MHILVSKARQSHYVLGVKKNQYFALGYTLFETQTLTKILSEKLIHNYTSTGVILGSNIPIFFKIMLNQA